MIAILAVLATILIPTLSGAQNKPYAVASVQCGRAILAHALSYKAETGNAPTNISQLGPDVAEVCTQQGVRVRQYAGGLPNASTAGDGSITPYGPGAYWVWHPNGSAVYYTSPLDNMRLNRTPY